MMGADLAWLLFGALACGLGMPLLIGAANWFGARLLRSPEPNRSPARALLDRRLVAGEISPRAVLRARFGDAQHRAACASPGPAMRPALKRYIQALWIGIGIQIGGRILDGRWHATHDEFEGASQQLEAHWLLWLGVAVVLAVSGLALARLGAGERSAGLRLVFASAVFYAGISVWHFIEHANGNDPEVAHVLLAVGQIGMIVGAVAATLQARGTGPAVRRAS